jgi:hypothetical protein
MVTSSTPAMPRMAQRLAPVAAFCSQSQPSANWMTFVAISAPSSAARCGLRG